MHALQRVPVHNDYDCDLLQISVSYLCIVRTSVSIRFSVFVLLQFSVCHLRVCACLSIERQVHFVFGSQSCCCHISSYVLCLFQGVHFNFGAGAFVRSCVHVFFFLSACLG